MDFISLSIAGLGMILDSQESGISFELPLSHEHFQSKSLPEGSLYLQIRDGKFSKDDHWGPLLVSSTFWGLWQDPSGDYLFIQSDITPPERNILVNRAFQNGVVYGEFSNNAHDKLVPYPLQNIEINLIINWLAGFNDLILHAVGINYKGNGYCFVGPSGVGKSTLATALVKIPEIEILGEDNIILRYREDQFWIYGTPWHENENMCAAGSAPLQKIYFLDRTLTSGISHCMPMEGVIRILKTAFIPYYRRRTLPGILERLQILSQNVPFAIFHYLLGADLRSLFWE
jgi:hypothetical protein